MGDWWEGKGINCAELFCPAFAMTFWLLAWLGKLWGELGSSAHSCRVVRGDLNPAFLQTGSSRRSFGQNRTVLSRRARLARARKMVDINILTLRR